MDTNVTPPYERAGRGVWLARVRSAAFPSPLERAHLQPDPRHDLGVLAHPGLPHPGAASVPEGPLPVGTPDRSAIDPLHMDLQQHQGERAGGGPVPRGDEQRLPGAGHAFERFLRDLLDRTPPAWPYDVPSIRDAHPTRESLRLVSRGDLTALRTMLCRSHKFSDSVAPTRYVPTGPKTASPWEVFDGSQTTQEPTGGRTFYESVSIDKSLTIQGGYAGCAGGSTARATID